MSMSCGYSAPPIAVNRRVSSITSRCSSASNVQRRSQNRLKRLSIPASSLGISHSFAVNTSTSFIKFSADSLLSVFTRSHRPFLKRISVSLSRGAALRGVKVLPLTQRAGYILYDNTECLSLQGLRMCNKIGLNIVIFVELQYN